MKTNPHSSVLFTLAFILGTGCATSSIVKKPEINRVKKVAIVSITAPQKVPHKSGRGEVQGWGDSSRNAIADQAWATYSAEFKKLGWDVIPAATISAIPVYQKNFAPKLSQANNGVANTLNTLSSMDAQNTYFSPTGLFPITWDDKKGKDGTLRVDWGNLSLEKDRTLKDKMQEVAAASGADAAVLVEADYCYDDGNVWVGHAGSGTGNALITGASAIYAVTPQGVEVIRMKHLTSRCGGENRAASDSSTAMVKGNLLYKSETIQKMFAEVAKKNAADNVALIQKAMKD